MYACVKSVVYEYEAIISKIHYSRSKSADRSDLFTIDEKIIEQKRDISMHEQGTVGYNYVCI